MKKMLVVILAMFVLSLSSIVSAQSIQGNWSDSNNQIVALDGPDGPDGPPPPHRRHPHHRQPPEPPDGP